MKEPYTPHFFGDWIKRRRVALDLTQGELAERAGCSIYALRKIESGERRPSKQLAKLLAKAIEIPQENQPTFIRVARGELPLEKLRVCLSEATTVPYVDNSESPRVCPRLPSCRLPFPPTPLVGRDPELAALERLFSNSQCRLLTLTGLGGIGKTRLAVEFARRQCAMFSDIVVYAPLASLTSVDLIVPAVAEALALSFSGPSNPKEQLIDHLASRSNERLLLVLDNLEHLLNPSSQIDGRTDAAALVAEILERLPNLRILTTSRERLNIRGEWTYELHGLPVPAQEFPDKLEQYGSAELFIRSAERTKADFAAAKDPEERLAIIKICQLLEGIPLAIELATAWVGTLSCGEIAREIESNIDILTTSMRDIPERHRSMRATFDHSWRLLSDSERDALCRLSVFRGGFNREAAAYVAGASLPLLASLVSKSLVRRTENGRYDLHEVVRQYAGLHLSEEAAVSTKASDRHSDYFLALVADREKALKSGAQQEAIHELTGEMDNIRAAWIWAVEHGKSALLASAIRSLGWMFEVSGLLVEGIEQLGLLVQKQQANRQKENDRVLGMAYVHQGLLYFRKGEFARAQCLYDDAVVILRAVGDSAVLADALIFKGVLGHLTGEYSQARSLLDEGLACARASNDQWFEAFAIFNLGYIDGLLGDYQGGYARMMAGVEIWRDLGDPHAISMGLNHLISTLIQLRRFEECKIYMEESIALCERTGNRWGIGTAYRYWGLANMAEGKFGEAHGHFQKSLDIFGEYYQGWDIARSLIYLGEAKIPIGDLAGARITLREALALARDVNSAPLMLEAIAGLARIAALGNDIERALALTSWLLERESVEAETRACAERLKAEIEDRFDQEKIQIIRERLVGQSLEAVSVSLLA